MDNRPVTITPEALPEDVAALKRIIRAMAQDAVNARAEIRQAEVPAGALSARAGFGRSSEKLAREAEQLKLAIETLEADQAERLAPDAAAGVEAAVAAQKPACRPFPDHLPR
jgi:transposase